MTDKADASEAIVPGCATDAALEAFVASCNSGPDRLFFTESWGRPLLERVRASLPASLGQEDALLLRNVLDKRIGLAEVAESSRLVHGCSIKPGSSGGSCAICNRFPAST